MPNCGMVVEEWLAEDFPLKIDQSTKTTKFTSCAHWDTLIQVQVQVYISKQKNFNMAHGWFGVWYNGYFVGIERAVVAKFCYSSQSCSKL
jgi:hypothetical protein